MTFFLRGRFGIVTVPSSRPRAVVITNVIPANGYEPFFERYVVEMLSLRLVMRTPR